MSENNQSNVAAILLAPDGSQHVCYELSDGKFWAAGMLHDSPAALADLLHAYWFAPSPLVDRTYERQEASFGEDA